MKSFLLKTLRIFVASSSILISSNAYSSSSTAGLIYNVTVWDGKVLFFTTGTRTAAPSCQGVAGRWAIDATTAKGQAMFSALLTASAMGKPVVIMGTGSCADWGDTESVQWLQIP
ncbi:hypothetical protein [Sphingomonas elodea]|uniref:hypothetical protein n=1 Tax=Sphingomonas elodea TaxID=179878 RepID=UPI0011104BB6|nr:hypothetical protein [Sphingomonas elodea]